MHQCWFVHQHLGFNQNSIYFIIFCWSFVHISHTSAYQCVYIYIYPYAYIESHSNILLQNPVHKGTPRISSPQMTWRGCGEMYREAPVQWCGKTLVSRHFPSKPTPWFSILCEPTQVFLLKSGLKSPKDRQFNTWAFHAKPTVFAGSSQLPNSEAMVHHSNGSSFQWFIIPMVHHFNGCSSSSSSSSS